MQTPEGKVKEQVKRLLRDHKAYYFMPVQNGMGAPSLDFLVCHNGQFLGIETKAPGKKATPRQEVTMQQMRNAGAMCLVVDGGTTLAMLEMWLMANARTQN